MRQLFLLILFASAITGICYLAATPVTTQVLARYSGVAERIEADLGALATTALEASTLEWASAEMDGQIAILRGEAPREEERAEAIAALLAAAGPGGWMRGGIVAVRDLTTIAPPVSPYEWRAVRSAGRVTLIGATPTRAARAELVAYAGQLFPGGVADQMLIARGAPDETAWLAVARTAIAQVAALEEGRATLRDERLTIEGRAADSLSRDRVTAALAQLPSPFLAAARVEAPEAEDGQLEAAASDARGLEPIAELDVCRDVFSALLEEDRVEFAEGEAAIAKESYPLLDRLAIAAMRCEGMGVTIQGGGEPTSGNDAYVDLGLRRAQAVADYFILKGISQDRLGAEPRARTGDLRSAPVVEFEINL